MNIDLSKDFKSMNCRNNLKSKNVCFDFKFCDLQNSEQKIDDNDCSAFPNLNYFA